MYLVIINLLLLCALFDFWYQKIRFDILIILLFMSIIFKIENRDLTNLLSELLFVILIFSILYIINHFINKNTSFDKNMLLNCLSSGDKILFLSLIIFLGVNKGLIIILFGLLTALMWVNIQRNYFKRDSCQIKTIPIYPFIALSLLVIDII